MKTHLDMERSSYAIPRDLINQAHEIWLNLSRHEALPVEVEKHRDSKNALVTAALKLFVEQQAGRLVELELQEAMAENPSYREDFKDFEDRLARNEKELPKDGYDYSQWAPTRGRSAGKSRSHTRS